MMQADLRLPGHRVSKNESERNGHRARAHNIKSILLDLVPDRARTVLRLIVSELRADPMSRSQFLLSISLYRCCDVGALAQPGAPEPGLPTQPLDASPRELRVLGGRTDYTIVNPKRASPQELPTWRIPNVPSSAEAYYAPDNYHVIAQAQDPDAVRAPGRSSGALTWIFSDDGKTKWRVNDRGQDACSYFFPDGKRVIFTSTRDNMDFPIGNWSNQNSYPQGASSTLPTSMGEIASA